MLCGTCESTANEGNPVLEYVCGHRQHWDCAHGRLSCTVCDPVPRSVVYGPYPIARGDDPMVRAKNRHAARPSERSRRRAQTEVAKDESGSVRQRTARITSFVATRVRGEKVAASIQRVYALLNEQPPPTVTVDNLLEAGCLVSTLTKAKVTEADFLAIGGTWDDILTMGCIPDDWENTTLFPNNGKFAKMGYAATTARIPFLLDDITPENVFRLRCTFFGLVSMGLTVGQAERLISPSDAVMHLGMTRHQFQSFSGQEYRGPWNPENIQSTRLQWAYKPRRHVQRQPKKTTEDDDFLL